MKEGSAAATGSFGGAAVAVALAMGAGCVVAPGRNEAMPGELVRRLGPWVRPVKPDAVSLVRAGLLRLEDYAVMEFALDDANAAFAHAASRGGPFRMTVLRP
jgi:hypothetical protein